MKPHKSARRSTNRKTRFERLERREMMAAVTARLDFKVLTVLGTDAADVISLRTAGGKIYANNKAFAASSVSKIVISAGQGDDRITVNEAIAKPTVIFAGYGNDTVYGGAGPDTVYGAGGDDTIYGRGGDDVLWGGPGNDSLSGGTGNNKVYQGSPVRRYTMKDFRTEVVETKDFETMVVELTNQERTKLGLRPLTPSAQLAKAANVHATNMARLKKMEHTLFGTTTPTPSDRIDYAGYPWTSYAENIALGYPTAQAVVAGWMASPGHRANILNPDLTQVGVSVVGLYWCQEFGRTT